MSRVVKDNEPAPEEKNAPKCAEPDTIVIEKVRNLNELPCPSPVVSSLHEAVDATGVVGPSLTVASAPLLNPMTTSAMETWPTLPRGVPLFWSSVMHALDVVTWVGGQPQKQPELFDGMIAELDVAVEKRTLRTRPRKGKNIRG